ncbi:uncharacterized protein [Typha angustifolia]|uniref:uncharacterized protein isoform X2 n=1 Tax=Typha angustifolia TaxID=59011 RepID=UPI003C2D6FFB
MRRGRILPVLFSNVLALAFTQEWPFGAESEGRFCGMWMMLHPRVADQLVLANTGSGMERKDDPTKPLNICYRIFAFLTEKFPVFGNKQISRGIENGATILEREKDGPSIRDELVGHGMKEGEMLHEIEVAILIPEGNDAEKPIAAPQDDVLPRKATKKSVTMKLAAEEINDMKRTSSDKNGEEKGALRVGELEKKPIIKAPSNINERSRAFIEKCKNIFASDKH